MTEGLQFCVLEWPDPTLTTYYSVSLGHAKLFSMFLATHLKNEVAIFFGFTAFSGAKFVTLG